jgi:AcrR family transcriptional regulator
MGLTAPALYRYYPDRDSLVTALIVEAFTSLASTLSAARDHLPARDHGGRYAAVGLAYRQWALAYPQRYNLIFGTPIAGYCAPPALTSLPAADALGVLIGVLQEAWCAGELRLPEAYSRLTDQLRSEYQAWREMTGSIAPDGVLHLALVSWSRVHGLVSLELYQALPAAIASPGEVFTIEINTLVEQHIPKHIDRGS